MKNITTEVQEFLLATGLRQVCLAKESGVSPVLVHRIVRGKVSDTISTNADKLRAAMARLAAATHSDFGDIEHKIHEKP